MTQTSSLLPTY